MEVREIYKISDMIHKAAGWKKENVFLYSKHNKNLIIL